MLKEPLLPGFLIQTTNRNEESNEHLKNDFHTRALPAVSASTIAAKSLEKTKVKANAKPIQSS